MRSFFIAIAVFGICSCARAPYFDLRHPVYMVADKSLWSGCGEKDSAGYETCRAFRVKQIYSGLSQWFDYFDKANRPLAVIVYSEEELPANRVNSVIYLKIKAGCCGKGYAAHYDRWPVSSPEIVFDRSFWITPRLVAHEFGHALGRGDNDVPEGTYSVMSYKMPTFVLPRDIKMMCRLHHECRMVKRKPQLR